MYLDNKGEAYFLKELDAEAEESAAYSSSSPSSSSSDDTDAAQSRDKMRPIKSKSCNYDSGNSPGKSNGEILASPRRSRILGFVFRRRSIKEFVYRDDEIGSADVACSKLLERAEIAAVLLELKWSTNLVTSKNGKYSASSFSANAEDISIKNDIGNQTVEASITGENDEQDVKAKGVISLITSSDSKMELPSELSPNLSNPEVLEVLHQNMVNERAGREIDLETKDVCNAFDRTLSESDCRVITGDQTVCSVEKVESHNISKICRCSDSILQVQEQESMRDEAIMSKLQNSLESDEEQFLFTDIDEFKAKEIVQQEESNGLEYVDPLVHQVVNDEYASIDKSTCPMSIPEICKAADEDSGRLVASLPNMRSCLGDVVANNVVLHPLSHSLDSTFTQLEGTSFRKDDLSHNISDGDREQKMVQEHLNIEGSHVSIAKSAVGDPSEATVVVSGNWRFWPFSMRRSKSSKVMETGIDDVRISDTDNALKGEIFLDGETKIFTDKVEKNMLRTNIPTSEQLASLNLKEGRNTVTFTFSTAMLGKQQVDARIYLWKWNTRIVISDVDGTITKSDVLGQFMPLVGVDWSHIGVAHLFSAIKENGYHMLFLSARAISQAYHTRQFLFNLKQDGKALPEGPVVISPDGLFPSLYREVIRRASHEFKIACLERIRELFPPDCNPFYAGFGNRDTDEISYVKVGIPRGKIFIINPKGEVAVNRRIEKQCYPSLHALVNGMFPPTVSFEQEDYNSWNFWKLPHPLMDI